MSWPDTERGNVIEETSADGAATLFDGDTGELPLETRRVLAQLLAGPSLDGRRHSKLWSALLRDEVVIRRRLSELFLELAIDRDLQVAFLRQANVGALEAPILLRSAPLTFLDSALLLYLRQRLTQSDAQGERAVVGADEMLEHLTVYERTVNTDRSGFIRRCQNSIEKIKKHSILQKIRLSDDRFEISPTLKLLFSADEILALTRLYERMGADDEGADSQATEDQEDTVA